MNKSTIIITSSNMVEKIKYRPFKVVNIRGKEHGYNSKYYKKLIK